jgi:hypothetical protein
VFLVVVSFLTYRVVSYGVRLEGTYCISGVSVYFLVECSNILYIDGVLVGSFSHCVYLQCEIFGSLYALLLFT